MVEHSQSFPIYLSMSSPKVSIFPPHIFSKRTKTDPTRLPLVCSHLDPLDLIHLSRVSKSFFKLVDGSSFKSVWIGVRKRIKLEDLEAEGLSELQYAAMVLDHHCQVRFQVSSVRE